jgi:hypothetical protein
VTFGGTVFRRSASSQEWLFAIGWRITGIELGSCEEAAGCGVSKVFQKDVQ